MNLSRAISQPASAAEARRQIAAAEAMIDQGVMHLAPTPREVELLTGHDVKAMLAEFGERRLGLLIAGMTKIVGRVRGLQQLRGLTPGSVARAIRTLGGESRQHRLMINEYVRSLRASKRELQIIRGGGVAEAMQQLGEQRVREAVSLVLDLIDQADQYAPGTFESDAGAA